jgi:hypothetical protein
LSTKGIYTGDAIEANMETGKLRELLKRFRVSKEESEKKAIAWELVRELAKYSRAEPFWEFVRNSFGISSEPVKEVIRYLEEAGELEIKRSADGKRLYVLTLRDIRENPVKLDRWLSI